MQCARQNPYEFFLHEYVNFVHGTEKPYRSLSIKIYIFMQCAPKSFSRISRLDSMAKCVNFSHIWPCCKVNSDQPSATGVSASARSARRDDWRNAKQPKGGDFPSTQNCYSCTDRFFWGFYWPSPCMHDASCTPVSHPLQLTRTSDLPSEEGNLWSLQNPHIVFARICMK